MSRSARVRPATAADAQAIAAFQCAMALETEDKPLDSETVLRGVRAALADEFKGSYLVAELDGEVVGSLFLTREWSDWRAAWFLWIQSVFTVATARGKGVFRALYDAALQRAEAAPDICGVRLYVEAENTNAQGVYAHLGMQRTSYQLFEVECGGNTPADG